MSSTFKSSVRKSYDLFDTMGRARILQLSDSLDPNGDFNKVALDSSSAYGAVFDCGLRLGQFNFQLTDFSYFQFSQSVSTEERFAFFPSPFGAKEFGILSSLTELLDGGGVDFETYSFMLESIEHDPRRPLIRYEYSESQYIKGKHPSGHFHFGTFGDDRWPVRRRLTPYAFSLLVARLYFQADWEVLTSEAPNIGRENELDDKYFAERRSCRIMPPEFFSEVEEELFHFA